MNYERQKRLVERLLERTRAGELSWQEGVTTNSFEISFPNNSVRIAPISGPDGPDYQIEIIDSSGHTNDAFNDEELDLDGPHRSGSWYSVMRELYTHARRKAYKSDEAIDNILAEIG